MEIWLDRSAEVNIDGGVLRLWSVGKEVRVHLTQEQLAKLAEESEFTAVEES